MNLFGRRLDDHDEELLIARELSWLSFNARVLQEAANADVPILQRLRYLGIFSNNLDEFFRVRVAEVRRLISISNPADKRKYKQLLSDIQTRVARLQDDFDHTYEKLLPQLQKRDIYLIKENQLDEGQAKFVRQYFQQTVLPQLEPILLGDKALTVHLTDESIYLAVDIKSGTEVHYALMEVPTDRLPRFIQIPKKHGRKGSVFIVLDDIIRFCMQEVFRGVIKVDKSSAYTVKFSRDAELEIDTSITESLIEKMTSSLKQRRTAEAVRFVYDKDMPDHLLQFLSRQFNLGKYDTLTTGGRYHNSKDFINFPKVGPKYLDLKPLPAIALERLKKPGSIFKKIRQKDILLYFPYHSFDTIVDLLKTAALDPKVRDIKICLYRVAKNSQVCDALINAVQNGKRVLAVVELQARFDEAANIDWAQRLANSGIKVMFGVPGLKVHSKLILIERREDNQTRYYSHIGTGNFNEKTSKTYTDFSLLTHDQEIGQDVYKVFDFLQFNYKRPSYKHLLVSPHTSRSGLVERLDREIANARLGYQAVITIKCNNLVDSLLAKKLYEASQAGVEVRLIIRGMCSVRPGLKGVSSNIRGISIVDRYLEHPRVYIFHNRGKPEYFIGSADLMTRNLDRRVEVLCKIHDKEAKITIQNVIDQQWHDNVKARLLDADQSNAMIKGARGVKIRSQETIHRYLASGKLPRYAKQKISHRRRASKKR